METDKARTESQQTWEAVAPGWERRRDFVFETSRAVSERLVDGLDPQPGQTILELACGAGDTGFMAAERLGDSGKLISTDFSPRMIEAARRRAEERGIDNAEFRQLDAEQMDLESNSVDGVLCRFAYMLMIDQAAAFAETRRVLRDGGRLAFAVWGPPAENPWVVLPGMVLVGLGLMDLPDPEGPGGIFSLADPDVVRAKLSEAGFRDVTIEHIPTVFPYAGMDEGLEIMADVAGPMAAALKGKGPDVINQIKVAAEPLFEPYRVESGYELPGLALAVVAA